MTPAVRRRSSLVAAVAAALLLTGCTFGPTPLPTRSPDAAVPATARPTPTVELEPIDPVTTVTEIVVRPEHLELVDSQGVLVATLSYDAEVSEFTGVLSTVLGGSPELTEHTASMETPATTEYTWSGVRVLDDHEEAVSANGLGGYPPIDMNVSVMFTGPRVGDGVAVRTVNGYQPGDDAQALAVELGEPWNGNGYDQVRVETGEPIGEQNFDEYENAYSVAVNTWEWRGASNVVFAPWNFGIGHV
jgi:hypothetical protein